MTHAWRVHANRMDLAQALCGDIAARLDEAVRAKGRASLAVSGGATPAELFDALSARALAWSRIQVVLVDERWVDAAHADSNERMVRERLLRGCAADAEFIGMKTPHPTPEQGLAACRERLASLAAPLECVVLGAGVDGHTASWFADSASLADAIRADGPERVLAVRRRAGGHARITLTLAAVLDSRAICVHVTGEDKRRTLERAERDRRLPVHCVLSQRRVPVTVYWAP